MQLYEQLPLIEEAKAYSTMVPTHSWRNRNCFKGSFKRVGRNYPNPLFNPENNSELSDHCYKTRESI